MVPGGEVRIRRAAGQFRLWPIGDIHICARGCAEDILRETIKRIQEDAKARWVGMGDYWDLISVHDKRWDPENIDPQHRASYFMKLPKEMLRFGIDLFAPIRSKCIGLLSGNHEYVYDVRQDVAMVKDLAHALKVPYLGYSCLKDLVFEMKSDALRVRIAAHHGAGWAQTIGGKINKLRDWVESVDADIVLMGHTHVSADLPITILGADEACEHLKATTKLGVISGTYLKTYHEDPDGSSSYGERKMYKPVPLGSPCVIIEPQTRRILIEKPMGRLARRA